MQKMLAIKQMFMRHISHEIRTPLNTVYMGLKLVVDELSTTSQTFDADCCLSTMRDTQESCQVAISILNDMLMFDAVKCGFLKLDKHFIFPVPFVQDIVAPFEIQVPSTK